MTKYLVTYSRGTDSEADSLEALGKLAAARLKEDRGNFVKEVLKTVDVDDAEHDEYARACGDETVRLRQREQDFKELRELRAALYSAQTNCELLTDHDNYACGLTVAATAQIARVAELVMILGLEPPVTA